MNNIWKAYLTKEQNSQLLKDTKAPQELKTGAFFSMITGDYTHFINRNELVYLNDKFDHNFTIEMIQGNN